MGKIDVIPHHKLIRKTDEPFQKDESEGFVITVPIVGQSAVDFRVR